MLIALDYDRTYTADPALWNQFIQLAQLRGHRLVCITMRHPTEALPADFPLETFYTGRHGKLEWAASHNLAVDIWIDDSPGWILQDSF